MSSFSKNYCIIVYFFSQLLNKNMLPKVHYVHQIAGIIYIKLDSKTQRLLGLKVFGWIETSTCFVPKDISG